MRRTFIMATIICLSMTAHAEANLISTFDSGADGWHAVDPTGDYTSSWQSSGGHPGGYLLGSEPVAIGGTGYFIAPSSWGGDWSGYVGGDIKYDLKVIQGTSYFSDVDVIITNGSNSVTWTSNINPVGDGWVTFDVKLTSANFGSNLDSILSNVTGFAVRGEFINGPEQEGFDNVMVTRSGVPEPTTWALMLMGLAGLGVVSYRRRQSAIQAHVEA